MQNKYLYTLFIGSLLLCALFGLASHQKGRGSPFTVQEGELADVELLGKRIFEDARLSEPAGMACASCHEAGKAFQGHNASRVEGIAKGSREEHFGKRNVPSLTYVMFSPAFHFAEEKNEKGEIEFIPTGGQFWDGRAADLVAQVEGPFLDTDEMNNPSKGAVIEKVKNGPYADVMKNVYGADVFDDTEQAFIKLATAVAAFESTSAFRLFSSKFDAVLQGKEKFTPLEEKGFALFKDPEKGNCLACHAGKEDSKNPRDWLFTDFTYDTFGLPRNGALPANADAQYFDLGLCQQKGIKEKLPEKVELKSLCGAFRVPGLRNIELTAPYGHNAAFRDLREIVSFYATRDTNPKRWYPQNHDGSVNTFDDLPKQYHANVNTSEPPYDRKPGEAPRLDALEIDAIVAFLKTLTDRRVGEALR